MKELTISFRFGGNLERQYLDHKKADSAYESLMDVWKRYLETGEPHTHLIIRDSDVSSKTNILLADVQGVTIVEYDENYHQRAVERRLFMDKRMKRFNNEIEQGMKEEFGTVGFAP